MDMLYSLPWVMLTSKPHPMSTLSKSVRSLVSVAIFSEPSIGPTMHPKIKLTKIVDNATQQDLSTFLETKAIAPQVEPALI
jgi:hypothetical protein